MLKHKITVVAIVLTAVLMSACVSYSKETEWIISEGEAFQGEMDTLREIKDRAKRDAENKAVEQAVGTFLKAHTIVSNSQIAEDLLYAAVRGKIKKQQIISAGWDAKDRNIYRVKLRAIVEPVYPERGEGLVAKLSLSKTNLKEGEEVRLVYQVNKSCYVYIFSIAADGSVTLLLPNSAQPDHFAEGKKAYEFPNPDTSVRLTAMLLPGFESNTAEEKIKMIAIKQKDDLLTLGFKESMLRAYDAKSTGMISDLIRRLNQMEPTDWTDTTAVYTINRK